MNIKNWLFSYAKKYIALKKSAFRIIEKLEPVVKEWDDSFLLQAVVAVVRSKKNIYFEINVKTIKKLCSKYNIKIENLDEVHTDFLKTGKYCEQLLREFEKEEFFDIAVDPFYVHGRIDDNFSFGLLIDYPKKGLIEIVVTSSEDSKTVYENPVLFKSIESKAKTKIENVLSKKAE